MPLFIPFLLGASAVVAGALGLGAAMDAQEKFEEAENIVNNAKRAYERKEKELDKKRRKLYSSLTDLGKLKKEVFETRGKKLLNIIENSRTSAEIKSYEMERFIQKDMPVIRDDIIKLSALDISVDATGSFAMAVLGAAGTYSAVMTFGVASTGTAISTLSGAAATNATLAWLGGGSLAAGGFGIAGGMWVLGGLVAGPALAIMGFSLNSKAEKALTQAYEYDAKVNQAIASMEKAEVILDAIKQNVLEVKNILGELVKRFDTLEELYNTVSGVSEKQKALHSMIQVFKAIKEVVNEPILDENGAAVTGLREKIYAKIELENIGSVRPYRKLKYNK